MTWVFDGSHSFSWRFEPPNSLDVKNLNSARELIYG
jgi:hypothetical protein